MPFEPKAVYTLLALAVFVVPKLIQRWGVPGAVTCLVAGGAAGVFAPHLKSDHALDLLSTFGVSALFLVAGLEVELAELRGRIREVATLSASRMAIMGAMAWTISFLGGLEFADAALVVVGVMTPSAGFILDSLKHQGPAKPGQSSLRLFVISAEILSLVLILAIRSAADLRAGAVAVVVLVLSLVLLRWLARRYLSFASVSAPGSEGGLLMLLAVVMALLTKSLGLYYITGAFVTGLLAQDIGRVLPKPTNERFLHSVEFLGSLFIPFYFFFAGVRLDRDVFTLQALGLGLGLIALALPLRFAVIARHQRNSGVSPAVARETAIAMMPTLVFSIVVGRMLTETGRVPAYWEGALVIYAIGSTLLPSIASRRDVPVYEQPILFEEEPPPADAPGAKE